MPVLLQAEKIGGLAELPGPIFAQQQCHGLEQQWQQAWVGDGELDMGRGGTLGSHSGFLSP